MDEAVRRMDQLEAEFVELSRLIREEVNHSTNRSGWAWFPCSRFQIGRFEVQRRHDMRQMFIEYLESLVQTHTEVRTVSVQRS